MINRFVRIKEQNSSDSLRHLALLQSDGFARHIFWSFEALGEAEIVVVRNSYQSRQVQKPRRRPSPIVEMLSL